jgi:predicted nucleic acid-binding protein
MFVVDASVVLAWSFADEHSDEADAAIDRLLGDGGIAPAHWPLELAQAIASAERRNRIRSTEIPELRALITALPVDLAMIDLEGAVDRLVDLARTHGLSVYDAAYVDLALSRGLGLATIDERLAAVCRTVGVPLIQ